MQFLSTGPCFFHVMKTHNVDLYKNELHFMPPTIFHLIKQRIIDNCVQSFYSEMTNSPKCFLYKNIVDNFTLQFYLCKPIPVTLKRMLSKIRLSSHQLLIESGRHYIIFLEMKECAHYVEWSWRTSTILFWNVLLIILNYEVDLLRNIIGKDPPF